MKRTKGLTEVILGIGLRRVEGSTSCRRFAIDLASLRRCDGEGSACQRRGLAIPVETKKRLAFAELKVQ